MATIFPQIVFQFPPIDGVNAPAGCKAYFYEAGSDIPKDIYSDQAGTPISQPVLSNSDGYAILYGLGSYKVVITKPDDSSVVEVDNVTVTADLNIEMVNNVSADAGGMRALTPGLAQLVYTLGYASAGDGCGQVYDWFPTSSDADDGVFTFSPSSNPANGRYKLRYSGKVDTRFAGFSGNAQDCRAALAVLSTAITNKFGNTVEVYFPAGQYSFTANYTMPENIIPDFDDGAFLEADSGVTVNMGVFKKGTSPLFTGDGVFTISVPLPEIYPEWWGAVSGGSVDNLAPITAMLAAINPNNPISFLGLGGYPCSADPGIINTGNAMFIATDIYKTGDSTTIYLKKGFYLNTVDSYLRAYTGYFAGDLEVYGDLSIGGTFGANALASLVNDVTSARDLIALRNAIIAGFMYFGADSSSPYYFQQNSGGISTNTPFYPPTLIAAGTVSGAPVVSLSSVRGVPGTSTSTFWAGGVIAGGATSTNIDSADYSLTVQANSLLSTNDELTYIAGGTGSGTITLKIGGTTLATLALVSGTSQWTLMVKIVRTGATTAQVIAFSTNDKTPGTVTTDIESPSIDWGLTNTFDLRSDTVCTVKYGSITFQPASPQ